MANLSSEPSAVRPELQEPFFHLGFTVTVVQSVAEAYLLGHSGAQQRLEDCLGRAAGALVHLAEAGHQQAFQVLAERLQGTKESFLGLPPLDLEDARQIRQDALAGIGLEEQKAAEMAGTAYDGRQDGLQVHRECLEQWQPYVELKALVGDVDECLGSVPIEHGRALDLGRAIGQLYLVGGFGVEEGSLSAASPVVDGFRRIASEASAELADAATTMAQQWPTLGLRDQYNALNQLYANALSHLDELLVCPLELDGHSNKVRYFGASVTMRKGLFDLLLALYRYSSKRKAVTAGALQEDPAFRWISLGRLAKDIYEIRKVLSEASLRLSAPEARSQAANMVKQFLPNKARDGYWLRRLDLVRYTPPSA